MARNVHIETVSKIRLPSVTTEEDRGAKFCKVPIRAFGTLDSVDLDKNSRLGLAYKFDSITVSLIRQRDGAEIAAPGINVSFPYQSDAVGFVIDWRQLTRNGGTELDQGCYQVKVAWTKGIAAGFFFECSVELLQYNNFNTEGYVNMFVVLNDVVTNEGISINYKDSGFATTIAFRGQFGYMQPNYLTTNNIYSPDNTREKARILPVRTYELRTNYLLSCVTQKIDEKYLLAANQIYITDWNANNHVQKKYTNYPVILSKEESPTFEYDTGVYATVVAVFKDKQQKDESKYDGNIKGSDNIILELPTIIGTTAVGTVSTTAKPLKSGQTVEYRTGDDGDSERGRNNSFFELEPTAANPTGNNPFGNNRRFTGITGGHHDGVQYVDVNGTPTTQMLAFPNLIALDWTTKHIDDTVLAFYYNDSSTNRIWDTGIDWAVALVIDSKTDWELMNVPEGVRTIYYGSLSTALNYPPFELAVSVAYWTRTTNAFTPANAMAVVSNRFSIESITKVAALRTIATRYYTLTELGL